MSTPRYCYTVRTMWSISKLVKLAFAIAVVNMVGMAFTQSNKRMVLDSMGMNHPTTSNTAGLADVSETSSHLVSKIPTWQLRQQQFARATEPFTNVTTVGFWQRRFMSGFRNQIMAFTTFIMWAQKHGHSQILLPTLRHKDTHGSDNYIPHEQLFDVEHWNSYYPRLPRMVSCNQTIFPHFNCTARNWVLPDPIVHSTHPYSFGKANTLMGQYMRYSQGVGPLAEPEFRNPVDLLILREALRPHPALQQIIQECLHNLDHGSTTTEDRAEYMVLHARVEPDMQRHTMCPDKKERNLTTIFAFLERKFPQPPATKLFMPINRQYLEKEANNPVGKKNRTNYLAKDNLKALNHAIELGLWNGTVKVFEFGTNALQGTKYENRSATSGAMLNFFIAIDANVFIGTEVSSYSHDLLAARFYRGNRRNYKYLPDGVHEWTPSTLKHAPSFRC